MDKYIGRLLDNRYEILEVIGTGGMAVVYKARCHRLNRLVAIKILKDDYLEDEEFRRRFHSESQAVAMLTHPNIVSVYDVSTSITLDYIVMELIDGITLKQYMEKKGVLNWKETLHFAIQIAKALDHAHSKGIVHRDIKPHNVMVLKNGSVKVTDFGIARMMSKGNTLTKEALGSVHYISPEQAKGGRVDNRSDIYSLGVVMYEMMSGRPPYDGESPVSVAIQHINGGAVMPSTLNPNIPGGLEQIIMKAMAHEPADRYATATQMLTDLDEFRKNPAILFDYNVPPIDAVTKIAKQPQEVEVLVPKTTAERIEKRSSGGEGRPAAPQRRDGTPQRRRSNQLSHQAKSAEEEKSNKITTIAIISCAAVMVLAIIVFLIVLFSSGTVKKIEVPNFLGQVYEELGEYEFAVKVDMEIYDDEHAAGVIIGQSIPAGGEVVKNGTVYVTVSLGQAEDPVHMPDVAGKSLTEAEKILKDLSMNLKVKTVQQHNERVEADHVISASVEVGARLSVGQEVTLYVSMGTEIKNATMPDVVGDKKESAAIILDNQNLKLDIEYVEVFDSNIAAGIVISTDPVSGGELTTGQKVTLTISKGPELARMPDLVDRNIADAVSMLTSAGFMNYEIESDYSDADRDVVIKQSEKAYEEVDKNTTIIITVSKGKNSGQTNTEKSKNETIALPEGMTQPYKVTITSISTGEVVYETRVQPDLLNLTVTLKGSGTQYYKINFEGIQKPQIIEVNFDK